MAIAIYTVNKHAKTASKDSMLYPLKHKTLIKLIKLGNAKKIGLHKSISLKSQQHYDVAINVSTYLFHLKPTALDFKTLPYLGERGDQRNPKVHMSLKNAKYIIEDFLGTSHQSNHKQYSDKAGSHKSIGILGGYLSN